MLYMTHVIYIDTTVPSLPVNRYLPWWLELQRDALEERERLLTAAEIGDSARREFGNNVELMDIQLSIDLNEEQMLRHIVEESIQSVLPRARERSLKRGDVTRASRPKHFKCAICLGERGRVVRTRCRHYFHRECIENAYRYDVRCPTCRQAIVPHQASPAA